MATEARFTDNAFLDLLCLVSSRFERVVARTYGNGAWYQFSGHDLAAHLGRAASQWQKELGAAGKVRQVVLVLARPSYNTAIAIYSALLSGFDVLPLPAYTSFLEVEQHCKNLNVAAIATDFSSVPKEYQTLQKPVFKTSQSIWLPQDKHPEPSAMTQYKKIKQGEDKSDLGQSAVVGRFLFLSIGHDGQQILETLQPDALALVAHHFILQVNIPSQIMWRSLELLSPSVPFAHVGMMATLLKKGVVSFENPLADWSTNLKILRPTVIFAGPSEMLRLYEAISQVQNQPGFKARLSVASKLESLQKTFLSGKSEARLPEPIFNFARRSVRSVSKSIIGSTLFEEAVQELRCIVHGLAPADPIQVQQLERFGIPVIETFGTTSSGGILSTNTYVAPFLNVLGNPLSHVAFRLGQQSILEYKIDSPVFENAEKWIATGDVVRMDTHGFAVVGRHKHLYLTSGGTTIAPARIERLLKSFDGIAQACVVGDRQPYLSALIVLNAEWMAGFREDAAAVQTKVEQIVSQVNENLPRTTTIKKFAILDRAFQEKDNEILANGEINRIKIADTRRLAIQNLYAV